MVKMMKMMMMITTIGMEDERVKEKREDDL